MVGIRSYGNFRTDAAVPRFPPFIGRRTRRSQRCASVPQRQPQPFFLSSAQESHDAPGLSGLHTKTDQRVGFKHTPLHSLGQNRAQACQIPPCGCFRDCPFGSRSGLTPKSLSPPTLYPRRGDFRKGLGQPFNEDSLDAFDILVCTFEFGPSPRSVVVVKKRL